MATYYVWDGGNNTTGADWTNAFTTIWRTWDHGDIILVDSSHNETQASTATMTTSSDDADEPLVFITVNSSTQTVTAIGSLSYQKATGTYTAQVSSGDMDFNFANCAAVFIGLKFDNNDDYLSENDCLLSFVDCDFKTNGTGSGADNALSSSAHSRVYYHDCSFAFGNDGQGFNMGNAAEMWHVNSTFNATVPTTVWKASGDNARGIFIGCDLSSSTNVATDVGANPSGGSSTLLAYKCKLPANVFSQAIANSHSSAACYACDTTATHNGIHVEDNYGQTNDDTGIYRSATYDGTNGYSLKTVSTADGEPGVRMPAHRFKICDVWADANSTFDVELMTTDAVTADTLNDKEYWIDIAQPDATGPLGTISVTLDTDYIVGTASTLTTGDSGAGDWTNELSDTNYYKCSVTVSGGAAGVHTVYGNVSTDSVKTIYTCPDVDVT